ncbi:hypothetical protein C9I43_14170 [Shewanella morhuae]|uniref:Uncharacterized protein n=2 Tax=Shewanella morhuae TaxID=365591 RepID=A0ABX5HZ50_9GAMM|nr:hypothetical protein C9I43_14170 [Shewanella morhuae]
MPMVLWLLMVGIEVASAATFASASQHNESMAMPIAKKSEVKSAVKSAVKIRIFIARHGANIRQQARHHS